MTSDPVREQRLANRAFAVVAAIAAAATAVTRQDPVTLGLLAIALVPWGLDVLRRPIPAVLFGVVVIAPVAGIAALHDAGVHLFVATAALSRLASRSPSWGALAAVVAIGVLLPFVPITAGHAFDPGDVYFAFGDVFAIVVGLLLQRSRRLGEELRAADARIAAAAAGEERTRLARDVHDLVAHSLTVVVLQVGGARRVLRTDPSAAEAALTEAERVCRDSLDGIREVVGLLRTGDTGAAAPDLGELVETYRAAGVAIDLDLMGDLAAVPLVARGTMARVVQESLANAARYRAPDAVVRVEARGTADGVQVRVANRRVPGAARASGPGGNGLPGLAERVAAVGGSLTSGADGDDWVVACRLPRSAAARQEVPR